jgi:CheY-like chemotaxis protein
LKILVLDDEPMVLRVVKSVLGRAGYDITAADNAEAALEFAAAK